MKLTVYQTQLNTIGWPASSLSRVFLAPTFLFCLLMLLQVRLAAQTELICDGTLQTIAASGTPADFILPTDTSITQIELVAHGGDGGFADLGNCSSDGGSGAHATAQFSLGDAEGAIPYGSTVRFIVGVAGEKGTGGTVLGTGNTYGGGGGGTGIIYKAPSSDEWALLMVAGGGGGAHQGSTIGICVNGKTGQGGRAGINGGDGNGGNGGLGGMLGSGGMAGGLDGLEVSGGGGGAYTKGEGITCLNLDGSNEVAEGQLGFPNGGPGGGNEGCAGTTFRDGGFGFGGGASGQGGGGGGGGFSGGGGGGRAGRGGGGGSYIVANALNPFIEEGGLTSLTEDGFAQYRCIKRIVDPVTDPPVAACIDTTVSISLNTEGLANLVPALISSDTLNTTWMYSLDNNQFNCNSLGESTVTLLVQDSEGKADSCTTTVRIIDEQAPELDCPISVEVSCDADFSLSTLGMATVSDNCGSSDPQMTEAVTAGDCPGAQTITRTWTATDDAGNTASCDQLIVVSDTTAPTCSNCPEDITVNCDAVPDIPELVLVDNCDPNPSVAIEVTSIQTATGCGAASYTETRTWTLSDACGNTAEYTQVVTVVDDEAPVCLNCPQDITVSCGALPEIPELELVDNCDPAPSVALEVVTTPREAGCGAYSYTETRIWTVSDACGNSTEYRQVITVVDEVAPVCLNCPGAITVSCEAIPELPALEVSDNCDPAPAIALTITSTQAEDGSCNAFNYTETRTWIISDACGNSTEHIQVITVTDTAAPAISCPPAITVTCDDDPSQTGFPTVIDNCDPTAGISYEDVLLSGDCDWACKLERTWKATDACGNSSTCVQTIERSVLALIEDALTEDVNGEALSDPLVIGRLNRHSLTLTSDGAACLLEWLPNTGGKALPLVRTDFLIDGSDCSPAGLRIGDDGKMNNPLLAETLIMGIKLRLDPTIGDVLLSDLDCAIHPIVFQGLPRNPTVLDLYLQANLIVGNIVATPFAEYFATALACINGNYGFCTEEDGSASGRVVALPALEGEINAPNPVARVYPNPVRSQLWLDLSGFSGQSGQISLFNATGQRVMDRSLREITTEPMAFSTDQLSNGLYLLRVQVGDQVVTKPVVVQGQ